MKQNNDETRLSFLKKVTSLYANKMIDAQEWASSVLGEEFRGTYSDEYVRRASTFFRIFLDKIEEDIIPSIDSDEIMEDIIEAKEQLFKERCKLQDENRIKNKNLREEARFEKLCEVLEKELKNSVDLPKYKVEKHKQKSEDKKTAVLCLSDWHCGSIIDNQWNYYDIDEMNYRANIVLDKTVNYCLEQGVTDLIVEINGDMCDGSIHISSRVQQEQSVIEQIVTVSNVLTNVLVELSKWFETVKVYTTLGNHGRLTPNKADCVTKENFEMLIPVFLREKMRYVDNVSIIDSKGMDFLKYNIGDKVICMAHGQNDSLTKCIADFSKIYKTVPEEVHLGHTHAYKDINDCDCIVNVNGSLVGSDDYALSVRKVTKPSQNLIIYGKDRCLYSLKANE